jgi:hypothetical protein
VVLGCSSPDGEESFALRNGSIGDQADNEQTEDLTGADCPGGTCSNPTLRPIWIYHRTLNSPVSEEHSFPTWPTSGPVAIPNSAITANGDNAQVILSFGPGEGNAVGSYHAPEFQSIVAYRSGLQQRISNPTRITDFNDNKCRVTNAGVDMVPACLKVVEGWTYGISSWGRWVKGAQGICHNATNIFAFLSTCTTMTGYDVGYYNQAVRQFGLFGTNAFAKSGKGFVPSCGGIVADLHGAPAPAAVRPEHGDALGRRDRLQSAVEPEHPEGRPGESYQLPGVRDRGRSPGDRGRGNRPVPAGW